MKINKENIEEVIFDFHEGNLDDVEKADLMDFLHKYPEYEKEFVLWAKTYHSDKQLLDYGNDERFVKKPYSFPAKWVVFAGGCLLAGLAYWLALDKKEEKANVPMMEQTLSTREKASVQKDPVKVDRLMGRTNAKRTTVHPEEAIMSREAAVPKAITIDTIGVIPKVAEVMEQPDSIAPPQIVTPSVAPVKKIAREDSVPALKKTRKRRKLDLTPTNHILPFNSDL